MQISHWKIAASNCIHVDLQPCWHMSQAFTRESAFVKKLYIYHFVKSSENVPYNLCCLRSVMVLDIDSIVAGSCFGCNQTVGGGVGRACRQLG